MLLKPHETTSGSLWHAREVELMKTASKSHECPPSAWSWMRGKWWRSERSCMQRGGGGADGWVRGV